MDASSIAGGHSALWARLLAGELAGTPNGTNGTDVTAAVARAASAFRATTGVTVDDAMLAAFLRSPELTRVLGTATVANITTRMARAHVDDVMKALGAAPGIANAAAAVASVTAYL